MKRLLIVDDDKTIAAVYERRFSRHGYKVDLASSGEAAIERIRDHIPDAVLLDLMLPGIQGLDVLRTIRADTVWKQIPVVVFTNMFVEDNLEEIWRAGANQIVSKAGVAPEQVVELVRAVLEADGTAPKPVAAPPGSAAEGDVQFEAELRRSFLAGAPADTRAMLELLRTWARARFSATTSSDLYRKVHSMIGNAALCGLPGIARQSAALEALLRDMLAYPDLVNASSLRTATQSIETLATMVQESLDREGDKGPARTVLVVDDEDIARRALSRALEKANLRVTSVGDPVAALALLKANSYDLIFLDIVMPGMDGFELCSKLRGLPLHTRTPVVFVSSTVEYEQQVQAAASGGNDTIAKPFSCTEVMAKALSLLSRSSRTKQG